MAHLKDKMMKGLAQAQAISQKVAKTAYATVNPETLPPYLKHDDQFLELYRHYSNLGAFMNSINSQMRDAVLTTQKLVNNSREMSGFMHAGSMDFEDLGGITELASKFSNVQAGIVTASLDGLTNGYETSIARPILREQQADNDLKTKMQQGNRESVMDHLRSHSHRRKELVAEAIVNSIDVQTRFFCEMSDAFRGLAEEVSPVRNTINKPRSQPKIVASPPPKQLHQDPPSNVRRSADTPLNGASGYGSSQMHQSPPAVQQRPAAVSSPPAVQQPPPNLFDFDGPSTSSQPKPSAPPAPSNDFNLLGDFGPPATSAPPANSSPFFEMGSSGSVGSLGSSAGSLGNSTGNPMGNSRAPPARSDSVDFFGINTPAEAPLQAQRPSSSGFSNDLLGFGGGSNLTPANSAQRNPTPSFTQTNYQANPAARPVQSAPAAVSNDPFAMFGAPPPTAAPVREDKTRVKEGEVHPSFDNNHEEDKPKEKVQPRFVMHQANDAKSIQDRQQQKIEDMRKRDQQAEQEADQRRHMDDRVTHKIDTWAQGRRGNLRALLAALHLALWDGATWNEVTLAELITPNKLKITYRKSLLLVHPDRMGTDKPLEHRIIAERIFEIINEAAKKEEGL
eukprot:TRINITY_DN12873_c0_g1_i1.p1 TRINITY_DN12873_c0_g1~~TRINITY_DN12873_c0_g1_i1.p1  ORF type:complete len:621 (-),score=192.32 TRINITY_DN12873_c0_g1_i1:57-1919(-)